MKHFMRKTTITTVLVIAGLFAGCDMVAPPQTDSRLPSNTDERIAISTAPFLARTNTLAYQFTTEASQQARALDTQIQNYLHQPDEELQNQLKQAWQGTYRAFLKSAVFSYIDMPETSELLKQHLDYRSLISSIDSWPIAGGYIDYVQGYPYSGIVNDLTLTIDESSIRLQHGFADPSYASTGLHPMSFMIWGENQTRKNSDYLLQENTQELDIVSEGGYPDGAEPLTEEKEEHQDTENNSSDIKTIQEVKIANKKEIETIENNATPQTTDSQNTEVIATFIPQNNKRRRSYLKILGELLINDLERIQGRWEPSRGYYSQFLQTNNDEVLLAILDGIEDILRRELIVKRLSVNEEHYSQSNLQDPAIILSGLKEWLIAEEDNTDIVKNDFVTLTKQLDVTLADQFKLQFSETEKCYQTLAEKKDLDVTLFEPCKKATNDLLATFKQISTLLKSATPASYRVGSTRINNDFK